MHLSNHLLVRSFVILVSSLLQDRLPWSQRQAEISGASGFHWFKRHDPTLLRCAADATGRCYRHHVQVKLADLLIRLHLTSH